MSKKTRKDRARYADVLFHESGSVWTYEVPGYLRGKVAEGDVVVASHDGRYITGTVQRLKALTRLRDDQVRPIVDKVRTSRFESLVEAREAKGVLLGDMRRRADELDVIERGRLYGDDPEMRGILEGFDEACRIDAR